MNHKKHPSLDTKSVKHTTVTNRHAMSSQPPEDNASRKRSCETATLDQNGRPSQEPRLSDELSQRKINIHGGNTLIGQAPAPAFVQNAQMNASAPQQADVARFMLQPLAQAKAKSQNDEVATGPPQPHHSAITRNASAANQQVSMSAGMADLLRQAVAHAQVNNNQTNQAPQSTNSAALSYSYPAAPPLPQVQPNHFPVAFHINRMIHSHQNQNNIPVPFLGQQQPAASLPTQNQPMQMQQQVQTFGMQPQELLNYAVMVNILHNSSQGNNQSNLLSNLLSNSHQMPTQQNVNTMLPVQQGTHLSYAGLAPVAAAPQGNPIMQSQYTSNSSSSTACDHAVSPSIPSESDFAGTNPNSPTPLPSHVIEAKKIDPTIRCVPLWTHQDKDRLSTQQCWLRKQIETFPASERDVRRHTRGRNRVLKLGQIGIQCIHCKNLTQGARGKGSSYFLSSTKGIYQAAQNILGYHYKEDTCPIISQKLLQEMTEAGNCVPRRLAPKAGKSRSGGGKPFWVQSALNITGLVDTTVGIRYADDCQNYRPLESVTLGLNDSGVHYCPLDNILVSRDDKSLITDFVFLLMSQFVPYADESLKMAEFSDRDSELDDDDDARRGGIACRFCKGVYREGKHRDGVFLSIKPSTMMRNKQLAKLHNHLVSCRFVPEDLKRAVTAAKETHLPQCDQLKRGWKKVFFTSLSLRLKSALDAGGESSVFLELINYN